MKQKEFALLRKGDIVKHITSEDRYVVTGVHEGKVIAVRSVALTNPVEWDVLIKSGCL